MQQSGNRLYAEVILPLPLYESFTYSVPEEMEGSIERGMRVLVQFGKRRCYTGLVVDLHANKPVEFEAKDILSLLDDTPLVRHPQLNLWNWVSQYYLCSAGEVFKAAVPAGLKPESETVISLNPDFDYDDADSLPTRQRVVVEMLTESSRLKIEEIEKKAKIKNCAALINRMLDAGIVEINERLVERYRAKKEKYVRLTAAQGDNEALHQFFDSVKRSQKQEKLLIAYLDSSGWLSQRDGVKDVLRDELLKTADASASILKAVVDKGIFEVYSKAVNRFKEGNTKHEKAAPLSPLSEEQSKALRQTADEFKSHDVVLLRGVTGSGKTEIYTHLIEEVLNNGRQVLLLVPEISLTTQLTDRLRNNFGDRMIVYHSKFTDNERADIWKRLLKSNEPMLIVGVRSSVFLPFANLGLIIVDEEHESSYKQFDPAPRYNARDTAIVLASMHGAKTLLGSATPSIETYYKALNGKFGLVQLTERYQGATLPDVEIVDMRRQRKEKRVTGSFSEPLLNDSRKALADGRQVILFRNRRGYSPLTICRECGWTPKCRNCDVSLVYHKNTAMLRCHYCGFSQQLPNVCPACGQNSVETIGYGTERIAEEADELFTPHTIARMDLDSTRNKEAYQTIIQDFAAHKTDMLIGTQMVTKGLDFGDVRIVGVINADTVLNFPDFRSNERAFNMLEQVAGRAGRRNEKGRVIIQTSKPDEPILDYVKRHDYISYFENEIEERRKYAYPPFTRIINIYIKNRDYNTAAAVAVEYALRLRDIFGNRVLGPEKPFIARVANWHLQTIMLKVESQASMKKVKEILHNLYLHCAPDPRMKSSVIYYDVDPV